jgi:hypothetical protein
MERTVRAWLAADRNATRGSRAIGLAPSTMRQRMDYIRRHRPELLAGGKGEPPAVSRLADKARQAAPETWWHELTEAQRADLLQLKDDHLAGRHKIGPKAVFTLCVAEIGVLQGVGPTRFQRWLTDAEERLPRA